MEALSILIRNPRYKYGGYEFITDITPAFQYSMGMALATMSLTFHWFNDCTKSVTLAYFKPISPTTRAGLIMTRAIAISERSSCCAEESDIDVLIIHCLIDDQRIEYLGPPPPSGQVQMIFL